MHTDSLSIGMSSTRHDKALLYLQSTVTGHLADLVQAPASQGDYTPFVKPAYVAIRPDPSALVGALSIPYAEPPSQPCLQRDA